MHISPSVLFPMFLCDFITWKCVVVSHHGIMVFYDVLMLRTAYLNGSYKIWTNVDQSNFIWWPQGKRKYWDRLHNWIASIGILNTRLQVIHYWLLLFRMVTKGWITTNTNQVTTNLTMPRLTLFFYHCVSDFIF